MELLLYRLFAVILLCSPGILGGCREEIASDQGFMECMMGFSSFFQTGLSGLDPSDENAMMKLMCSDEGMDAFGCVLDYLNRCEELLSTPGGNPLESLKNMTGIDMATFLKKGGMEGVCAMIVGPCSEVKTCMTMGGGHNSGGVMKRGAPAASVNNYMMFVMQSDQICGSMKPQVECMLEKLQDCPPEIVSQVEDSFENAIKMTMPDQLGIVSFKDTKEFLNECPYLSKVSQQQNSCIKSVFTSMNFTKCYQNISKEYKNQQSCVVYEGNKACIMDHVSDNCGEQTTQFFIRNSHFIWPGIPDNCAELINSGIVTKMSFGVILISLLASMIRYIN